MHFRITESDADVKRAWNDIMKKAAKERLSKMKHLRKAEAAPNRKAKAKLDARVKDWAEMVGRGVRPVEANAFHKPGSMKVH